MAVAWEKTSRKPSSYLHGAHVELLLAGRECVLHAVVPTFWDMGPGVLSRQPVHSCSRILAVWCASLAHDTFEEKRVCRDDSYGTCGERLRTDRLDQFESAQHRNTFYPVRVHLVLHLSRKKKFPL